MDTDGAAAGATMGEPTVDDAALAAANPESSHSGGGGCDSCTQPNAADDGAAVVP